MNLLDLFCGAGGAGAGYQRAGWQVTGVDIVDRPSYPGSFWQMDAFEFLRTWIDNGQIRRFSLIHASPPCQADCYLTIGTNRSRGWGRQHDQVIPMLRTLLSETGLPYVMEQPGGTAPVRKDIKLCGEMFGLGVLRHRHFELGGWRMDQPEHIKHRGRVRGMRHGVWFQGPYVAAYGNGGGKASVPEMQEAMEIPWTEDRDELTEAIPPAYTELIGKAAFAAGIGRQEIA